MQLSPFWPHYTFILLCIFKSKSSVLLTSNIIIYSWTVNWNTPKNKKERKINRTNRAYSVKKIEVEAAPFPGAGGTTMETGRIVQVR